jgi:hypothetical protein
MTAALVPLLLKTGCPEQLSKIYRFIQKIVFCASVPGHHSAFFHNQNRLRHSADRIPFTGRIQHNDIGFILPSIEHSS